jgi:hypothetical protein
MRVYRYYLLSDCAATGFEGAGHLPESVTHLDLAKRPTGVGNRIPVLSVPAIRRERH